MQKHRTIGGASSLESTFLLPAASPRSLRRATARRASTRRATAREHKRKRDVESRIIEYLGHHPRSTTGEIAKGVDARRDRVAAELARMARAGDVDEGSAGPKVIDRRVGDDRLDAWVRSGPSAAYTFLYPT